MKKNRKRVFSVFVLLAATALILPAQTLTTLYNFDGADGSFPLGALVQARNGDLYGTADNGGVRNKGTIFKITPGGTVTTLYSFCALFACADGEYPMAGLVQAANGDFYGTTSGGGANSSGTAFKLAPGGKLTTVVSFNLAVGKSPYSGLIQAPNGDFYGTTLTGGGHGYGTVFKLTPSGTLTTLYSFCALSGCTDGEYPSAALVRDTHGNFYGTTFAGGAYGYDGTIFEITPTGALTTLYSFCAQSGCPDGAGPAAGLIQTSNGDFYGTTAAGGNYNQGTIFKMTPKGALTTLYSFNATDGSSPYDTLVQGTDGNLYGTTRFGANTNCTSSGCGTIFKITPAGTLTTLYKFCSQANCADGDQPLGGLVQATNGNFYGVTSAGGTGGTCTYGCGTIFQLSLSSEGKSRD